MDVKEAILKRRSTRDFLEQEISDDLINELLESAMAAPSACNKRPWEFYVIKNKEIQAKLRKVSRYSDYQSSLIIVVAADTKRSLSKRPNDFWIQDCSAAIENMLLTATSLRIGSCWCGLFPMVTPQKRVQSILELTDNIIPLALIHFGYPKVEVPPRTQYEEKYVHIISENIENKKPTNGPIN